MAANAFICFGAWFAQAAPPPNTAGTAPAAEVLDPQVGYCFARLRGLDPGREVQAYLALQLHVTVAYRNAGTRPLILPLESDRTIYVGLDPSATSVFRNRPSLFEPAMKPMKSLPAGVNPESPVSPKNDVFTVIPAGGELTPPRTEEITLPVNRKGFKQYPDLRGHRFYIQLQYVHLGLAPAFKADLAARWSSYGVLWTGTVKTNIIAIDVPVTPEAAPCRDTDTPAHTKPSDPGK